MRRLRADVCVAGGGPAGIMLGLLLARRGVPVIVCEKHETFLRDFRGDTVHPSTLTLLDELGLGPRVDQLPHHKVGGLNITFADGTYTVADFSRLRVPHPYLMFVPQWDFLELLAKTAEALPAFTLLRSHPVTGVLYEDGRVAGVTANGPDGPVEVRARVTVAADGRTSTVRAALGLRTREFGAPMDVLWFRLSRTPTDADGLDMHVATGRLMLAIDRGDYWQIAYVIPKGGYDAVVAQGLPALRDTIAALAPALADRVSELSTWDDLKMLTVQVNRARRWHVPGALLIGDAAHAMSPVGGVGINLAIQDAVAAARLLARKPDGELGRVRRRRLVPTVGTQLIQRGMQAGLLGPLLAAGGAGGGQPLNAPLPLRLLRRFPALQRIPARIIGVGLRPEHVPHDWQ